MYEPTPVRDFKGLLKRTDGQMVQNRSGGRPGQRKRGLGTRKMTAQTNNPARSGSRNNTTRQSVGTWQARGVQAEAGILVRDRRLAGGRRSRTITASTVNTLRCPCTRCCKHCSHPEQPQKQTREAGIGLSPFIGKLRQWASWQETRDMRDVWRLR